ncbi:MAG: hypothetical protein JSS79_20750 [Bacteroidetes bacterium]|nr:hypothetical protein [Bacteroidota bacterium]
MTRKTRLIVTLCLGFWSSGLLASPQMPDYIIIKGDTIPTYNLLLESYLSKLDTVEAERLFGLAFRDGASLNCWRGYQAIYLVQGDSLFLAGIIPCGSRRSKNRDQLESLNKMKSIFGDAVRQDKVFINWFSGVINYPIDKSVLRWDGVFYTIYERETVLRIDRGIVTGIKEVHNYEDDPKGIDRRDKQTISAILFKQLKRARWKNSEEFDCSEKYIVTINEEGYVSKVRMLLTDEEKQKYHDQEECDFCMNKMLKSLKKLKFDIIKDKGVPISEDIYIEIWMEDNGKLENWTG